MRTAPLSLLLVALTLPLAALPGCGAAESLADKAVDGSFESYIFLKILGYEDAQIRCGFFGGGCPEGLLNFGLDPRLSVMNTANDERRSLVKFVLPTFNGFDPEVVQAFLAVLGDQTPATAQRVRATPIEEPWKHETVTWSIQPSYIPNSPVAFDLEKGQVDGEDDVWLSPNITLHAQYKFENPHLNYGFILDQLRDASDQPSSDSAEFHSNNSETRTAGSLGKGPVFYIKLRAPAGFQLSDVNVLPPSEPRDQLFIGQAAWLRAAVGIDEPDWWVDDF